MMFIDNDLPLWWQELGEDCTCEPCQLVRLRNANLRLHVLLRKWYGV